MGLGKTHTRCRWASAIQPQLTQHSAARGDDVEIEGDSVQLKGGIFIPQVRHARIGNLPSQLLWSAAKHLSPGILVAASPSTRYGARQRTVCGALALEIAW